MATFRPVGARRYAKPIVVPERLDLLTGPVTGMVRLPRHLDWAADTTYDLDSPGRIVDLYRTVIAEALSPVDLNSYLNHGMLHRLWASMWLPPAVRQAWERCFPELAELRRPAEAA